MKSIGLIALLAALLVSQQAFAWGAVQGRYGGAAYRGPYGGAAVRTPSGATAVRGPYGGAAGLGQEVWHIALLRMDTHTQRGPSQRA